MNPAHRVQLLRTIKRGKTYGRCDCGRAKWSPDGTAFAQIRGHAFQVWESTGRKRLNREFSHPESVHTIEWSPDGTHIATGCRDGNVRLWNIEREEFEIISPDGFSTLVDWSPNGSKLAFAGVDQGVRIYDRETGVSTLTQVDTHIYCLKWSTDGTRIALGLVWGMINVVNVSDGSITVLYEHKDLIRSLDWSPDGTKLVSSSSDSDVRVWNVESGECILTLTDHAGSVHGVSWSPDGRWLASGAHKAFRVWNAETGECIHAINGHKNEVTSVDWAPDSVRLLTYSSDRTTRIWQVGTLPEQKESVQRTLRRLPDQDVAEVVLKFLT